MCDKIQSILRGIGLHIFLCMGSHFSVQLLVPGFAGKSELKNRPESTWK
jgi:hypothetical protein